MHSLHVDPIGLSRLPRAHGKRGCHAERTVFSRLYGQGDVDQKRQKRQRNGRYLSGRITPSGALGGCSLGDSFLCLFTAEVSDATDAMTDTTTHTDATHTKTQTLSHECYKGTPVYILNRETVLEHHWIAQLKCTYRTWQLYGLTVHIFGSNVHRTG